MKESINQVAKYLGWIFLITLFGLLVFDFLKRGIFERQTGINLLVVGENSVGVLVIRPDSDLVNWIPIPNSLKVKIYNSSATYPIGSLWGFGVTEKKPYQITEMTIGDSLGIIVPRMVKIDEIASVENLLGQMFRLNLKTNLSIKDRWVIRKVLSTAAVSKKVFELEIPKTAFDKVIEADGKEFLVVNKVVDVWTKDKFYHDDILNEGADVSINNVSDIQGVGLTLSGQLESSGFRVVEVVNNKKDDVKMKGCTFVASKKFPRSVNYLEKQVGCKAISRDEPKETSDSLIKIWLK